MNMPRPAIRLLCLCAATILSAACRHSVPTIDTREQLTEVLTRMGQSDGVLFGQHDATLYGHGWCGERGRSDCSEVTGDYPAVVSFDLGHIETGDSVNIDGIPFRLIREAMTDQYARGGIVSVSWHPRNFATGGSSWDTSCDSVVRALLPGGSLHYRLTESLDSIANLFLSLAHPLLIPCCEGAARQGLIPVIFRPWHEQNGTWFWWGASCCTAEEYKSLYRFTHDYLTARVPEQIVWAYSPNLGITDSTYMLYYPGDAYVDMLGVDCYHFGSETPEVYQRNLCGCLDILQRAGEVAGKPIALTETGLESCPIADWWTQVLLPVVSRYPLSYVLLWRNAYDQPQHYYVPFAGDTSAEDFRAFYRDKHTYFLKQLNETNKK